MPPASLLAALTIASAVASGQTVGPRNGSPLTTTFAYTSELVVNVAGGAGRGTTFPGVAGVQASLSLKRLVGWSGARVFVFAVGTHGGAPSVLVGDAQGVSNLEAHPALRIEEAWLQQNLFENRLSWLLGRYDVNTEFYRLQSASLFINSSFGIGPELSQSGAGRGPSIYPTTRFGTRLDFKPSRNTVWRAAAVDGPMLISEVALLARPDTAEQPRQRRFAIGRGQMRGYAAKLALGAWYYTGQFADLSGPTSHRGSAGAYLLGDVTLQSLSAFAQLGLGDGRVNQLGGYVGAGLTLVAPIPSRAQDMVGLAVAAARNGSHFERAQLLAGMSAAGETSVELTYLAQIGSWLGVQPDAQYVIHPGATRLLRNATVLGLRVALTH
jgi:porin